MAQMTRKELEACAWRKTPDEKKRNEIRRQRYDFSKRAFDPEPSIEKLKGENREILVFNPSGDTPGTMNVFMPLWSLYSDELETACASGTPGKRKGTVTMRAPYSRYRKGYTGSVED